LPAGESTSSAYSASAWSAARSGRPPVSASGRYRRVSPQRHRQRHVRVLVDAGRQLQRAAADVEDQQPARAPPEPPADRQEGQPGLVLTGEDLQVDAGLLADPAEHRTPVVGVPDRGGDEGQQLVALAVGRLLLGLLHRGEQGLLPCLGQLAVIAHVLGQPEQPPVVVHRRRVRSAVGVDDEQVDGVRADVQHPESHDWRVCRLAAERVAAPTL